MARLNWSTLARASCFLNKGSWPLLMASSTSGTDRRLCTWGVGVGVGRAASADCVMGAAWLELWASNRKEDKNTVRKRANERVVRISRDCMSFTGGIPW